MRLGATGAANSQSENLSREDIDALFAFAKVADGKVIYSLHGAKAAETAKYVWDNYRPWLDYFAFDNEPDGRADRFDDWRMVVTKVRDVIPDAKFAESNKGLQFEAAFGQYAPQQPKRWACVRPSD
ncbi:MAG: hypothetical protein JWO95_1268 [Verrucomicrobiales bacterium]|nr:hypothetical protein [Verrucomicrobiales bacterium]